MTREKSQQADLQSRFSKQEQELKKVVEQQLLEHQKQLQTTRLWHRGFYSASTRKLGSAV